MRFIPISTASLLAFALAASTAQAQFYKLHNADVSVGAIGQFTTPLTTNGPAFQGTTDSLGGEFSLREHPVAWAGIELNYAYTDFHENLYQTTGRSTTYLYLKTQAHEATAAYVFHPHFKRLQPFLNIGGGSIDFLPSFGGPNQWRGAGLVELGFDIPTSNPHFGFRVQGRSLIYRAPTFNSTLSSKSWVSTEEPSLSAYWRF